MSKSQLVDSRKKIVTYTIIAILASIAILAIMEIQFPLKKIKAMDENINEQFFDQDFSKTKNIILLGTSHVAGANTTVINEKINTELKDKYTVYNLGYGSDNPSKRTKQIDKIISMNPKIVFYGISYYDFPAVPDKDRLLSKALEFLSDTVHQGNDFDNPQLFTRSHLFPSKDLASKNKSTLTDHCFSIKNTPFDEYCDRNRKADTIQELKELPAPVWPTDYANERMNALSEIIEKFQKRDIKVVIFVTPVHKDYYIDRLSDYQKNSFEDVLKIIRERHHVDTYDFRYKYDNLPIWSDTSHIIQSNGSIYEEDIARMIIEEIR